MYYHIQQRNIVTKLTTITNADIKSIQKKSVITNIYLDAIKHI